MENFFELASVDGGNAFVLKKIITRLAKFQKFYFYAV